MPLSVKDGMGAWIKDFKDSNAPQFKGKSDKERRDMAIAAYMSAKRGGKPQEEGYVSAAQRKAVWANRADGGKGHPDNKKEATEKPPFTGGQKRQDTVTDKSGAKHTPMSRARDLARKARDMQMKKESVEHLDEAHAYAKAEATVDTANIASKKAMKQSDMEKLGKVADMLAKERKPQKEEVELDEAQKLFMFKTKAEADKKAKEVSGKVVPLTKQNFAVVVESVEHLDEAHAYAKAAKALHDYGTKNGGIDKKDFHAAAKHLDNIGKAGLMQKGAHIAKFNDHFKNLDTDVRDRIHMTLKQHGVMEAVSYYGNPNKDDDARNAARRKRLAKQDNIMKKRAQDNEKARQALKDPSHNPAWANSKSKVEAVSADHLKFATSKSKAVQDYMKKRAADRDVMNKKNDPNAAKKGYALSATPPERAYMKARKKGMSTGQARDAMAALAARKKNMSGRLPESVDLSEEMTFKVSIEGLPVMYMTGTSPGDIKQQLRKIVKQPSMIDAVQRVTDTDVKKAFRLKAQGKDIEEAKSPNPEDNEPASPDEKSMAMKQAEFVGYVAKEIQDHLKKNKEFPEWMQNKLSAFHQKSTDMHSTLGAHGPNGKDD
jgi:hypothetical protein